MPSCAAAVESEDGTVRCRDKQNISVPSVQYSVGHAVQWAIVVQCGPCHGVHAVVCTPHAVVCTPHAVGSHALLLYAAVLGGELLTALLLPALLPAFSLPALFVD